jgi:CheY-like chemotaxis protein
MDSCEKVLIVDDDEDDRLMLITALRDNGVTQVDEVTSGEDAVEYVSRLLHGEQPQLIFVDLTLKEMSGLDLMRWLRQNTVFDHIPVVVLSGSRDEEHKATAIALKAKAYYDKPETNQQLDQIVKDALEHCRQETF